MIVSNCKFSKCGFGIFEDTSDDVTILEEPVRGHRRQRTLGRQESRRRRWKQDPLRGAVRHPSRRGRREGIGKHGRRLPVDRSLLMGAHATVSKNKISNAGGGIEVTLGSSASLGGPTITTNTIKTCFISNGIRVEADTATIVGNSVERILSGAGISLGLLGITPQGNHLEEQDRERRAAGSLGDLQQRGDQSEFHLRGGQRQQRGQRLQYRWQRLHSHRQRRLQDFRGRLLHKRQYQLHPGLRGLELCPRRLRYRHRQWQFTRRLQRPSSCGGEGCDNSAGATATSVANCSFSKCRIDFAGNGTLAQDLNNTFKTGGPATAPQID